MTLKTFLWLVLRVSKAPVNVQPATNVVGPEGWAFSHKVFVAPGVIFLKMPKSGERKITSLWTGSWTRMRRPFSLRQHCCCWKGDQHHQAYADRDPLVHNQFGGPAYRLQAADRQYYKYLFEQQAENMPLKRKCVLPWLNTTLEELKTAQAVRKATRETQIAAIFYREQCKKVFALLGQAAQQEGP